MYALTFSIWVSMTLTACMAEDKYATWREFNLAFGERMMTSSVGTVDQLALAIRHEDDISVPSVEEDRAKFSCASYQNGTVAAALSRSAAQDCGGTWMSPLFVSIEEDLLCFIIRCGRTCDMNAEIRSKLSFIVSIPAQMKLEPNVVEMIDVLTDDPTETISTFFAQKSLEREEEYPEMEDESIAIDLSISYFSNSTTIYPPADVPSVDDNDSRSAVSISNLQSYKTSSLSNFYWTESGTSKEGFNLKVSRHVDLWGQFQDDLGAQSTHGTERSDPCGFDNMDVFSVDGDIIVPLNSLISSCDVSQAAACLAFIVSEYATDPMVSQISLATRPVVLNYRARSIQQFGQVGTSESDNPFTAAGLTGLNQVVGVADTGLDEKSCFFIDHSEENIMRSSTKDPFTDLSRRKVVQYSSLSKADKSDLTAGHGTHVAGTVAGYNGEPLSKGGRFSGVAPAAKLAILDMATSSGTLYVPYVSEHYKAMRKATAYICSNSWGSEYLTLGGGSGSYTGGKVDGYLYKNMDTLILFANGNSGEKGLGTVSNEASGKNVVGVGASESNSDENVDYVAYFSSMGPTYDGRIKPDVVAPGAGLTSAKASKQHSGEKTCATTGKQGTSMATPAAAGAAALLRQYFEDADKKFWTKVCYPSSDAFCSAFTPSGVLLKALMLHSGDQMSLYHNGNKNEDVKLSTSFGKPDFYQGYGRVQLSNVLPLPGETSFQLTVRDLVDIAEKTKMAHKFKVKDSSHPLVITLAWYDPPATSGAAKALVNDLDLILKLPNGEKVNGNYMSDHVNVNERISIKNPPKGKYKVFVKANALPVSGRQRFAFVLTYAGTPLDIEPKVMGLEEEEVEEEEVEVDVEGEVVRVEVGASVGEGAVEEAEGVGSGDQEDAVPRRSLWVRAASGGKDLAAAVRARVWALLGVGG